MNSKPVLVALVCSIFLFGCNHTQSTEPASYATPEPIIGNEGKEISLTDTANWSQFSFSTFSLLLPANWQVTDYDNEHTTVSFQSLIVEGMMDTLHITVTTEPGNSASQSPTSIYDSNQDITFNLNFGPEFSDYPDFQDTIVSNFKTRMRNVE